MAKVIGMEDVEKLFKEIEKVSQKVITKAAKAGAKIPLAQAKKNAPTDTGTMKRSLKMKAEKTRRGRKVYKIKFVGDDLKRYSKDGKDFFYPVSVEYGYMTKSGKKVRGKRFLRDSIDENREKINQTILETMYEELKKVK